MTTQLLVIGTKYHDVICAPDIMSTFKAMKSCFTWSYDKQNLTWVVTLYEIYEKKLAKAYFINFIFHVGSSIDILQTSTQDQISDNCKFYCLV